MSLDCQNRGKMKWSTLTFSAFLSDGAMYQILLCMSVKSLLRFKSVKKSWCALIESRDFIKQHLHYQHYDRPTLKRENHRPLFCHRAYEAPITFLTTSVDKFEPPTTYLQLDFPNLHEYFRSFPAHVDVMIFNGIVCLHIAELCDRSNNTFCLWNPATKQYRLLPQSSLSTTPEWGDPDDYTVVGFGFDVKTNDYKVVRLIISKITRGKRVEVYSLSTDSWRSIDVLFPVNCFYTIQPKMPFNNGTCFCWLGRNSQHQIFCFDFSSELFRSISFPNAITDQFSRIRQLSLNIVSDKIAWVFTADRECDTYAEIWVLNGYGSINEYWVKLYKIDDPYSKISSMHSIWLSNDGTYLFFVYLEIGRYNLVTGETKLFSVSEFHENLRDCSLPQIRNFEDVRVVEFKESLISIGGGDDAPTCTVQQSL